jgi:hypothetical protein
MILLVGIIGVQAQLRALIYKADNLNEVTAKHEKIAILPFNVTLTFKKEKLRPKMSENELKEVAYEEGVGIQRSVYAWLLKQKTKDNIGINIQDVDQTNALLKKAGIKTKEDFLILTKGELAKILGVDAVLSGHIITTQLLSQAGAVAFSLFFISAKSNQVDCSVTLHNAADSELLWSFDRLVSGNFSKTSSDLSNFLMRRVSKKFPYKLQ